MSRARILGSVRSLCLSATPHDTNRL
jgi:hypothetical protein